MAAPKRPSRPVVAVAVRDYRESLEQRHRAGKFSANSLTAYTRDLLDFVRLAGPDRVLDELESEDLDEVFIRYASEDDRRFHAGSKSGLGRGLGTQYRFAKTVSALFTYAERHAWIQLNPVPDCVAKPAQPRTAAVTRAGIDAPAAVALLDSPAHSPARRVHHTQRALGLRDEFVLRVLMEAGVRVAELCACNRADLTSRDGAWWLTIRVGKGGKSRSVPLSSTTVEVYEQYVQTERPQPPQDDPAERQQDSNRALIVSHRGRRLTPRDVQRMVRAHCLRMDPRRATVTTPHGLRHTAATLLLNSKMATVKEVQALLGHASLATTGIYLEAFPERLAAAVQQGPVAAMGPGARDVDDPGVLQAVAQERAALVIPVAAVECSDERSSA